MPPSSRARQSRAVSTATAPKDRWLIPLIPAHRAVSPWVCFATLALLYHWPCHMTAESGPPAPAAPSGRPGWKQPCLRPRLGIPPCRSSGGGWKTRFISPRQDDILLGSPRPTVAVHLQYMHVVGEPVQQRAGEALRTKHFGPFVEGEVGGDQDGAPLVALAEDLEEEFRAGGGQGDKAQLVDDEKPEAGQLPLQVEQPFFVPGRQPSQWRA